MAGTITVMENIGCMTHMSSSCSRKHENKTVTISVRIPSWLYEEIKAMGVSNISEHVRKLLTREIKGELCEEEKLEAELDQLKNEMEKLQEYHSTLLKHGSYAQDYLEKLKDGTVVTHKPFKFSKQGQKALSPDEQKLVERTVKLREKLARKYAEKLDKLLKLKEQKWGEKFEEG